MLNVERMYLLILSLHFEEWISVLRTWRRHSMLNVEGIYLADPCTPFWRVDVCAECIKRELAWIELGDDCELSLI